MPEGSVPDGDGRWRTLRFVREPGSLRPKGDPMWVRHSWFTPLALLFCRTQLARRRRASRVGGCGCASELPAQLLKRGLLERRRERRAVRWMRRLASRACRLVGMRGGFEARPRNRCITAGHARSTRRHGRPLVVVPSRVRWLRAASDRVGTARGGLRVAHRIGRAAARRERRSRGFARADPRGEEDGRGAQEAGRRAREVGRRQQGRARALDARDARRRQGARRQGLPEPDGRDQRGDRGQVPQAGQRRSRPVPPSARRRWRSSGSRRR